LPAGTPVPGDCIEDHRLEQIGWYCFNAQARSHPVAAKTPNAWGLHDTAGNLYEWCNDIFDSHGYGPGTLIDPPGVVTPDRDLTPSMHPSFGPMDAKTAPRIMRGGNYAAYPALHAVANRSYAASAARDSGIGFRVVRSARR
jgi:formylglycine-generating enzyme required for sulfatase activity